MAKPFDYTVEEIGLMKTPGINGERLKELGLAGWELVAIDRNGLSVSGIFLRASSAAIRDTGNPPA